MYQVKPAHVASTRHHITVQVVTVLAKLIDPNFLLGALRQQAGLFLIATIAKLGDCLRDWHLLAINRQVGLYHLLHAPLYCFYFLLCEGRASLQMAEKPTKGHRVVHMYSSAWEQLADRCNRQKGQRATIDAHAIGLTHIDPAHVEVREDRHRQLLQLPLNQSGDDGQIEMRIGDTGKFLQSRAGIAIKDAAIRQMHFDRIARPSLSNAGHAFGR